MKRLIKASLLAALTIMAMGCSMKDMMVEERVSPMGFDETVKTIIANAESAGWVVPQKGKGNPAYLHKTVKKHLKKEILPVAVIKICNPEYAHNILADDEARFVSVMMPCSISVYQKQDGKTYVSNMKADKVGSMMGGTIAEVMDGPVSGDQAKMLGFLDNPSEQKQKVAKAAE